MNKRRLIALLVTEIFLYTTLARGADAAPAATTATAAAAQLAPVNVTTEVHAPSVIVTTDDYQRMQDDAPEVVTIHVTAVKTQPAQTENKNPGALLVEARAAVIGVTRSATKLAVGSVIYLQYGYVPPAAGFPEPPPTPVLKENTEYRAYLGGGPGNTPYIPHAGAQSFIDRAVADAAAEAAGPIANPAVLPTPDNPSPAGSVRVRGAAMDQFAKLAEGDGKWGVSIAGGDPIPLQSIGEAKPVLLTYYGPPLRSPLTQPTVIIYQAGVQSAPPPATGDVTVERALILDGGKRWLGDELWALRVGNNMRPLPLPIWHWNTYKVDIEDPETHATKTIMLNGEQAPTPVISPVSPSPATSAK